MIVAICYICGAALVMFRFATGLTAPLGSIVLVGFMTIQAIGHARLWAWALKITAVIFVVADLLAVPYLLALFEPQMLPSFHERLVNFLLITVLAALAVLNYYCWMRRMPVGSTRD